MILKNAASALKPSGVLGYRGLLETPAVEGRLLLEPPL
jgi:hypothetical protein